MIYYLLFTIYDLLFSILCFLFRITPSHLSSPISYFSPDYVAAESAGQHVAQLLGVLEFSH